MRLDECYNQPRTLLLNSILSAFTGEQIMSSLGNMTPSIIALDVETIGWKDMLHSWLPSALHRYQSIFYSSVNSRMTGTSWMKTLVPKLLKILHGQWLCHNFSLHNKLKGHLQPSLVPPGRRAYRNCKIIYQPTRRHPRRKYVLT